MFICNNLLQEDDQVIIEQVEQLTDGQDEGIKDAEIDDNNSSEEEDEEEKERVGIKFTEQEVVS